jgi:hypothetical protein
MNRRAEVVTQQVIRDHQQFMKELSVRDEKANRDPYDDVRRLPASMRGNKGAPRNVL